MMHNWNKVRVTIWCAQGPWRSSWVMEWSGLSSAHLFCVFLLLMGPKARRGYGYGGSFSGTLREPIEYQGQKLNFAGFHNLNATHFSCCDAPCRQWNSPASSLTSSVSSLCVSAQVRLGYCDGGSFSGTLREPIEYQGQKLYFASFNNLSAIRDAPCRQCLVRPLVSRFLCLPYYVSLRRCGWGIAMEGRSAALCGSP